MPNSSSNVVHSRKFRIVFMLFLKWTKHLSEIWSWTERNISRMDANRYSHPKRFKKPKWKIVGPKKLRQKRIFAYSRELMILKKPKNWQFWNVVGERSQMTSSKIWGLETPSPVRHLPSLLPDPLDDVIFHQPSPPFPKMIFCKIVFMVKLKKLRN